MGATFPLGRVLAVVAAIPREMLLDPSVSGPDFRIAADRLDHAARQCRALAEVRSDTLPTRSARPLSGRRAA